MAWITDLHFDFVDESGINQFIETLRSCDPDMVLLGGDIGQADSVRQYLLSMQGQLGVPIYFVLGNHDFYRGSIGAVRRLAGSLCDERPGLIYLTNSGVIELDSQTALIGHDGWADARVGDYDRSEVMLNDYLLIDELAHFGKQQRRRQLERLGDEAAEHVRHYLCEAFDQFSHVYLLTHVPPLREACWHEGQLSDDEWSPHFTCLAVGKAILDVMRARPDQRLTVLCGHTHGEGHADPLENIEIFTGGAEYGRPSVQRVFEIE